MPNCRIGDLAMIMDQSRSHPDNGKFVVIVGPGDDWSHEGDSRFHWECNTLGQEMFPDNDIGPCRDPVMDFADADLIPIRGRGVSQTTTHELTPQEITCSI